MVKSQRAKFYRENEIRKILCELEEKRESLGFTSKNLADYLCDEWNIAPNQAEYKVIINKLEGGKTFAAGDKSRERDGKRLSDYLAALRYSKEEAKNIFERLNKIDPRLGYFSSEVKPFFSNELEKRVSLSEGELVVALYPNNLKNGEVYSVPLSIAGEQKNLISINLDTHYLLKKSEGGLGGYDFPLVIKSLAGSKTHSLKRIVQLYIGKEDIVKKLSEWEGFSGHAKRVMSMQKPYVRD